MTGDKGCCCMRWHAGGHLRPADPPAKNMRVQVPHVLRAPLHHRSVGGVDTQRPATTADLGLVILAGHVTLGLSHLAGTNQGIAAVALTTVLGTGHAVTLALAVGHTDGVADRAEMGTDIACQDAVAGVLEAACVGIPSDGGGGGIGSVAGSVAGGGDGSDGWGGGGFVDSSSLPFGHGLPLGRGAVAWRAGDGRVGGQDGRLGGGRGGAGNDGHGSGDDPDGCRGFDVDGIGG